MPLKPITSMRKDRASAKGVKLQHRHFAYIANVIATSGERAEDKRRWANYFALDLEKTNPNFDRTRFFTAVGVDDPYVTQAAYPAEWSGSPDPKDPDNYWIDDITGERKRAP